MPSYYIQKDGQLCSVEYRQNKMWLYSTMPKKGYVPFVDDNGRECQGLYCKTVEPDEVDDLFSRTIHVGFQNAEFALFNEDLTPQNAARKRTTLYTNSSETAAQFGFEKSENGVFVRNISFKEIEYLRVNINSIKHHHETEYRVEKNEMKRWIQENVQNVE